MDTNQLITIMVSTVDCNILSNSKLMEMRFHERLRMHVINQKINNDIDLVIDKSFVSVINSSSKGLSKSRNLGLISVKTGFGIIADDDVSYVSNFEEIVRNSIMCFPNISVFTFQIQTPEGSLYKKYRPTNFVHSWKSILKVSSISVVFNVDRIKSNSIFFDESFGLGSKYPTGEENIFLNDLLKKNFIIQSIPKPVVVHPKESSGSRITNHLIFSKGAMFRRLYGCRGILFSILFVFKKQGLPISKKGISALKMGCKGFFTYSQN